MPPRLGVRPHLLALFGYFCLALLVTYPLALNFTTGVPGDLTADRDQNLWNLWWVGQAFGQLTNPFHTDLLYYPYGVDLYYHTLGLPLGIIGLVPQVLFGLPAAYNTVVLAAFTLSGYGAFRLGLLFTQKPLAAFLGGVVFAFTPYTLDALKGQTEVTSVQWIPIYAEAWLRAQAGVRGHWRHALLAGVFLAVALLSSLYYGTYLLLFTVAHLIYTFATSPDGREWVGRMWRVIAIVVAVTFVLTLPLITGLVSERANPRLAVTPTEQQRLDNSADLLSFFAPPHDHPLLGSVHAQPGLNAPPIHPYLTLGYIALALAIVGAIVGWRERRARFWVVLALIAAVLAMGPQLQVGRSVTPIPLPFKLLEGLPGWDAMAKVERLVVLVRLCMGVLAAIGAGWAIDRLARRVMKTDKMMFVSSARQINLRATQTKPAYAGYGILRRSLPFLAILALLLAELPIHPREMQPLAIPSGFQTLNPKSKIRNPKSALMELPFATRQAETLGRRMLFQTTHGLPIMGGYLARTYTSPITDQCSPFWGFISAGGLPIEGLDIATPTLESRPLDVLRFFNVGYIALYSTYGGPNDVSLDPQERDAFLDIVAHVSDGQPMYEESYVSLYSVDQLRPVAQTAAFHVANGWYNLEISGGAPFRWMKDSEATLCAFTSQPTRGALAMEGTAFGQERAVHIQVGDKEIYTGKIPQGGAFSPIKTATIEWPAGITEVRIITEGPGITPESLDPNQKDTRSLITGIKGVKLEVTR
jgi:hypothetical protein